MKRKKTIPLDKKLSKKEVKNLIPTNYARPKYRSDCSKISRPCPFVTCKYNLYLDVTNAGSIQFNFPDTEINKMKDSCVLDLAEKKLDTLEEVGIYLNITRERVRQIEIDALMKIRKMIMGVFK